MLPDSVIVIPWVHGDTDNTYQMTAANQSAWNVAVGIDVRVSEMMVSIARREVGGAYPMVCNFRLAMITQATMTAGAPSALSDYVT